MKLKSFVILAILNIFVLTGCTTVPPVDFTVQDVGMVDNRKDAELIIHNLKPKPIIEDDELE